MEEIWARGEATVRDIHQALNARGGKIRAYTTVLTVMTRLDAKGLVVRRRAGRLDVYSPALSREAYLQARAEAEVGRWSRTSATSRSPTSPATSTASTRRGWRSSVGSPVTDLRRAEFAVAAFGEATFLLALLFVFDAVRFHGDVFGDRRGRCRAASSTLSACCCSRSRSSTCWRSLARWARPARRLRAPPALARLPCSSSAKLAGRPCGSWRARARWRSAPALARGCSSPPARWGGSAPTRWPPSSRTRRITRRAATRCGSWSPARSATLTR